MKSFDCATEVLEPGVTLLEASAGTGKTYALARIFLRLVVEEGVEVGKLLTVTFTTAATEELRGRIRELLVETLACLEGKQDSNGDPTINRLKSLESVPVKEAIRRLRLAITCFDEAIISTIHGFCHRMLAENSLEANCIFDAELDQSTNNLVTDAVREYWRENFTKTGPLISAVASISKIRTSSVLRFFNKLPATQDYHIGFSNGVGLKESRENLLRLFEQLKDSWVNDSEEYLEFVATKIRKYTASKKAAVHRAEFDKIFIHGSKVTPDFISIFEYVRSSKLTLLKDFKDVSKPEFSELAEKFWQSVEGFSQAIRVDAVSFIEKKISGWKAESGIMSFDDLLSVTARAVARKDAVGESLRNSLRSSFQVAMIDEFQDTDPVQFKIFRELFAHSDQHWLFLIGDPKQSIYRFRGADLEAYFKFSLETKGRKFSLDTNYRTVTPLVEATNSFFLKAKDAFLHSELKFQKVEPNRDGPADKSKIYTEKGKVVPPLEIRELTYQAGENVNAGDARSLIIQDLVHQVGEVLQNGRIKDQPVRPEDIAILVRSNPQALEVWESLRSYNLPAVVFSNVSLFSTKEAKELLWVLEGLVECRNEKSVRRALATGLMGVTAADFIAWQEDVSSWEAWMGCFREHFDLWRKDGVYVALISLFRRARAVSQNLRRPDGERRVTNFLHLAETLHQASTDPVSPSSLIIWLRDQIEESGNGQEEYQLRLESESTAIQILTVHKSKGLEYPVVFCPFLGLSPHQRDDGFFYHNSAGELVVELKKTASQEAASQGLHEENQEDARVLYVALTRAASRCVLYHAPVVVSENKEAEELKIPSLTRILRDQSWNEGASLSVEDWKNNRIEEDVVGWIARCGIEDKISFISFDSKDEPESPCWQSTEFSNTELAGNVWPVDRQIPNGHLLRSFSGLVQGIDFEGKDLDAVEELKEVGMLSENSTVDEIFEFPSGANAGNFMHEVFEKIDFTTDKNWEDIIKSGLVKFGFDSHRWYPVIFEMIKKVVGEKFPSGFSLSQIPFEDRVEEMEFHFPTHPGIFSELCKTLSGDSLLHQYLQGVGSGEILEIESNGFLKGLMDLIFRFDGKFYLLDWKSNQLNGHKDGFTPDAIESEMMDHHYILQYHLYLVGLVRFLRSRIQDFDYKTHFGGVYYLFVRGMGNGSGRGIFYDLPDVLDLEKLESFLCVKT